MPLLEGKFDPTLFNAVILQSEIIDIMKRLWDSGDIRAIDLAQMLLDNLVAKKIIW